MKSLLSSPLTKPVFRWLLLTPLIGLAAWTIMLLFTAYTGVIALVKIQGFDPRDLLAGHYLQFRINLDGSTPCQMNLNEADAAQKMAANYAERCVCVSPQPIPSYASFGESFQCDAEYRPCQTFLRGRCERGQFITGLERFYFSEKYTKELAVVPQDAGIAISIPNDGRAVATALYVEGKPLEEYLKFSVKNHLTR